MKPLLLAVLAVSVAAPAFAQSGEGEYWAAQAEREAKQAAENAKKDNEARAKAKAAAPAPKPAGPCADNAELDGPTGFLFELQAKDGLSISFIYSGCRVEGGKAVRTYAGDQAGYSLQAVTEGKDAKLSILESWAGSAPTEASALGGVEIAKLVGKDGLSFSAVSVSDTRGRPKLVRSGRATLKAARFTPPWSGELTGCQ